MVSYFKKILVAFAVLFASVTSTYADSIPKAVINWVEANVVQVTVYTPDGTMARGSGFLISPKLVMTSCHVVDGFAGSLVSQQGDDRLHTVTVLKCDRDKDLALLSIDDKVLPSTYTAVANQVPRFGTQTFSAGYPTGMPLIVVEGHWQSLAPDKNEYLYLDTNHTLPGDSGSPVLILDEGVVQIVGVRTAVLTDPVGHMYPYIGFITPIDVVREFLYEVK